ncbi:MAG: LysR family transcriptional regulator [Burkholderiales bacterium]|nr:LysR family transcriptional regulator [Burkholderiales bacterium]
MAVPLVRLSALDFLRGFVAAGRRMSMALAAEDLCLTPSALSKQITKLEESLGVRLLVRGHRSIAFTKEGAELYEAANSALQQVQDAVGRILPGVTGKPVTITASIGVTALWLLPRLGRLQADHPDIDVRVAANNAVLDVRAEDIDLSIRYSPEDAVPGTAIRLFGETVAPVASPLLRVRPILTPDDLAGHTLLELDGSRRPWLQWAGWMAGAGWEFTRKPKSVLRFNQYDFVIQAAMAGQGIALGRLELLGPIMKAGQLQAVSTPVVTQPCDHAYWLVMAEKVPRRSVVRIADWIEAQARLA